jgi:hypothetical protein
MQTWYILTLSFFQTGFPRKTNPWPETDNSSKEQP